MRPLVVVHIIGGSVALGSGFLALYTAKGGRIHRRAGIVFVVSMLVMASAGFWLTLALPPWIVVNGSAATIAATFVATALTTVRPPAAWARWVERVAFPVLLAVAAVNLTFAFQAAASGGRRNGIPAFPYFLFGIAALFAVVGDVRMMLRGRLQGPSRIARHLWRMTFALWVASLSFFIGQAKVIPKPIRILPLLATPVLAVLVTMLYWLWRVRVRRSLRGLVTPRAAEAT